MAQTNQEHKPPSFLKPLFWSYRFDRLDFEKHKKLILVNVVNYGRWQDWLWLVRTYGEDDIKRTITALPVSEFRPRALRLIALLLNVDIKRMRRVRSIN